MNDHQWTSRKNNDPPPLSGGIVLSRDHLTGVVPIQDSTIGPGPAIPLDEFLARCRAIIAERHAS